MKYLISILLLLMTLVSAWPQTTVTKPTHITINPSGGGPVAPGNVVIAQQGGTGCQFNIGSPGCVSNSQKLQWTASPLATSYNVYRNSSLLTNVTSSSACSGSVCTYTDTTATGSNILSSYGTETVYAYAVNAQNGSGTSSSISPSLYMFSGGPNNSCANFSGGGMGATGNITNGSTTLTVTAVGGNPVNPYQAIEPTTGFPQYSPSGPQTPSVNYVLPGGSGGTGTYTLAVAATATATGVNLQAFPESCFVTQVVESGHTYSLGSTFQGGGYIQQVTGNPGVPPYDAAVGAMNNAVIDVYPTDCTHTAKIFEMSRPGGAGNNTGDIYSNYTQTMYSNCTSSYVSGGTLTANAWNHLSIPMAQLGEGIGTFVGYTVGKWHGTGSQPTNGCNGCTVTIQSTTDGATANIQVGDFMMAFIANTGTQGMVVTSIAGLPSSVTVNACTGDQVGAVTAFGSGTVIYDAQVVVQSISGAPPDNSGMVTGNSMPAGTFMQCTNAGQNASIGTWALANGNGSQIPSEGSSGSPVTFGYQRVSLYKPNIQVTGSGAATVFWDNFGWGP